MRRFIVLGLCSALLAFGFQSSASAAPAAGDFVFSATSGNADLYLVHADGSGLRRLTWSGDANDPAWSPDGRTVAYDHAGDIWLLTPGVGKRRLTFNGKSADPTWSSDGKTIAYSRAVNGYLRDIFLVPAAGGSSTRLSWATRSGCTASQPAWRPRTDQVAYVRNTADIGTCSEGIVVQRKGTVGKLIVPDSAASEPDYTADGSHLLFLAPCDPERCANTGGWETTAAGADRHMVVDQYLCAEGDLCLHGIVGSPAGGWVTAATYVDADTGAAETCYQGWLEDGSGVSATKPSFCLSLLGYQFDVRAA